VADNAVADVCYTSGRHTAPIFAGDTVFASTEIRTKRDWPARPDLGILGTVLRGHKFVRKDDGFQKVEIFYLEREIATKRRSHYC
jgi:acyl dehydratase